MKLPRKLKEAMHKHGFTHERKRWGIPTGFQERYILHPESFMDIPLDDIPRLLALPQDEVESEWAWREVVCYSMNLSYAEKCVKPFLMARLEAGV